MASTLGNILRLGRAGIVLAQHGVRFVPAGMKAPSRCKRRVSPRCRSGS